MSRSNSSSQLQCKGIYVRKLPTFYFSCHPKLRTLLGKPLIGGNVNCILGKSSGPGWANFKFSDIQWRARQQRRTSDQVTSKIAEKQKWISKVKNFITRHYRVNPTNCGERRCNTPACNIFWGIFFVLFSTLLHLPPLTFLCANGCWDRTQDRCNWCIGSQTL